MTGQATHSKVIAFQFSGGARDGQTVRSDRPESVNEADAFWALTLNGMVGRRFDVVAPNDPANQRYQVRSKYEDSGEIHVTCQYVGED